jgi:hypothetical protein
MFTVAMVLEKETKGALRYQEIDEQGKPVEQVWAKCQSAYTTALPPKADVDPRSCYVAEVPIANFHARLIRRSSQSDFGHR